MEVDDHLLNAFHDISDNWTRTLFLKKVWSEELYFLGCFHKDVIFIDFDKLNTRFILTLENSSFDYPQNPYKHSTSDVIT